MVLFQSASERPVAARTSALEAPPATLAMAAFTALRPAPSTGPSELASPGEGAGRGATIPGAAVRLLVVCPLNKSTL